MSDSCQGGCCGNHSHETDHAHQSCGCGGGCCGHDHHHDHHEHDDEPTPVYQNQPVNDAQKAFLAQLAQCCYLPLVRYVVKSTKEDDFMTQALGPAYIVDGKDSMAELRQMAAFLQELADFGLLTLDYDIPLDGFDYAPYTNSPVFAQLEAAVAEGQGLPGFWGDTATLETGSMGLTEAAMDLLGNWL